jgi:hypothetical protein
MKVRVDGSVMELTVVELFGPETDSCWAACLPNESNLRQVYPGGQEDLPILDMESYLANGLLEHPPRFGIPVLHHLVSWRGFVLRQAMGQL